ncbi:MAG: hypothetical protein KDK51_06945 [Deltaproteobacteria bacterium]|nr:hypothetical protein [Deltaproteobacteria bacterium]
MHKKVSQRRENLSKFNIEGNQLFFRQGKRLVDCQEPENLQQILNITAVDSGITRLGFPEEQFFAYVMIFQDCYWVLPFRVADEVVRIDLMALLGPGQYRRKELWFDGHLGYFEKWRVRYLGLVPSAMIVVPQCVVFDHGLSKSDFLRMIEAAHCP